MNLRISFVICLVITWMISAAATLVPFWHLSMAVVTGIWVGMAAAFTLDALAATSMRMQTKLMDRLLMSVEIAILASACIAMFLWDRSAANNDAVTPMLVDIFLGFAFAIVLASKMSKRVDFGLKSAWEKQLDLRFGRRLQTT